MTIVCPCGRDLRPGDRGYCSRRCIEAARTKGKKKTHIKQLEWWERS